MEKELNPQQMVFVEEYLSNGFNAVKAYMVAYKTNYENASSHAYRVKNNPKVQKAIDERLADEIGTKEEIANAILRELKSKMKNTF